MNINYIGCDLATTSGIAILNPLNKTISTYEIKGNPNILLESILGNTNIHSDRYYVEKVTHLRFPKVMESLFMRVGYIYWTLYNNDCHVELLNLNNVRKELGITGKNSEKKKKWLDVCKEHSGLKLTDNHSDSISLALYGADAKLEDYTIELR